MAFEGALSREYGPRLVEMGQRLSGARDHLSNGLVEDHVTKIWRFLGRRHKTQISHQFEDLAIVGGLQVALDLHDHGPDRRSGKDGPATLQYLRLNAVDINFNVCRRQSPEDRHEIIEGNSDRALPKLDVDRIAELIGFRPKAVV